MPEGPTPPPADRAPTRDRLLDAALRLFLEHGTAQVSLRAVNAGAGLNPGAVHYHFGSREGLVTALLERELLPLWQDRLEAATARPAPGSTPLQQVEALVAAVVGPFEELVRTERGRLLCRLLAQTVLAADRPLTGSPWSGTAPFEVVLGRALPDLAVRELADRWRLAFTTLLETYGRPLAAGPAGTAPHFPAGATVRAFLTAALSAPPADA
ncbi:MULTISPECIES: TetR/AcrR family transcriptional regulator [Kitasatospora]|uniref:Putative TetR family transcriptional regulator n=1 Tax=Kitasatospora setae (strain ATCC 33774 / DSM 43861 / JCM 3304 / KCC A-0304 / NBRC 14216 / KM-6054) TaxID=452652 RepID=E4NID0_KITSK|nr:MULTISPECIES: TetR/AcrR family transcriptional regulator [Kitasatospora]BAJ31260.1 putative TetR family transcriptional regulator [Kitasatospora setae KM-6054]